MPDVVEIGWTWLAPDAQRTGINTEAKLLMLTHAFESWLVHRVCLRADRRNERSRAAIQRLGAQFDGVVRAVQIAYDGTVRDMAVYSILDSEWPEIRGRLEGLLRHPWDKNGDEVNELTIRGIDVELSAAIRRLARREGISLNEAALRLLRKGAGHTAGVKGRETIGSSLDHLIGSWTAEEADAMDSALQDFETVGEAG